MYLGKKMGLQWFSRGDRKVHSDVRAFTAATFEQVPTYAHAYTPTYTHICTYTCTCANLPYIHCHCNCHRN